MIAFVGAVLLCSNSNQLNTTVICEFLSPNTTECASSFNPFWQYEFNLVTAHMNAQAPGELAIAVSELCHHQFYWAACALLIAVTRILVQMLQHSTVFASTVHPFSETL